MNYPQEYCTGCMFYKEGNCTASALWLQLNRLSCNSMKVTER